MDSEKNEISQLPLSWYRAAGSDAQCRIVRLFLGKAVWIALAGVPETRSVSDCIQKYDESRTIVIRGVNPNLANVLEKDGFRKYLVSSEAVLNLQEDHFGKKSMRELIRRGLRHGCVVEIERTAENISLLTELQSASAHSREPQLRNLFYQTFEHDFRLFVFRAHNSKWLGAVMISPNRIDKMHTELILRRAHAPVGIMEALVFKTAEQLKSEGYKILSLGEVPFELPSGTKLKGWERLINFSGNLLNFAYNSKGLFYFKNKFHPEWTNTYICISSKINLWMVFQLSVKTNFLRLTLYKLMKR